MLYVFIVFLLVLSTICFSLLIRCLRNKHNDNFNKIKELTDRISELECKLNKINSKFSIIIANKN